MQKWPTRSTQNPFLVTHTLLYPPALLAAFASPPRQLTQAPEHKGPLHQPLKTTAFFFKASATGPRRKSFLLWLSESCTGGLRLRSSGQLPLRMAKSRGRYSIQHSRTSWRPRQLPRQGPRDVELEGSSISKRIQRSQKPRFTHLGSNSLFLFLCFCLVN